MRKKKPNKFELEWMEKNNKSIDDPTPEIKTEDNITYPRGDMGTNLNWRTFAETYIANRGNKTPKNKEDDKH